MSQSTIVDKVFLEKILKEPVAEFQLSAGSKMGDNVSGSLQSIKVTLTSGKILNLVNKTLPEDPEAIDFAVRFGIFPTEITMYDIIIPKVEALMNSKKDQNQNSEVKLSVPKFISGNDDSKKENIYVCLEDVRPDGFIMSDKFIGLNLLEVTLVMKNIANLHASTYFWIKQEGEKVFDESSNLTRIRDSPFVVEDPMIIEMGKIMIALAVDKAIKLLKYRKLDHLAERVIQKLVEPGKESVRNLFAQVTKKTDRSSFPCIIHGDLWVNNIMFKYDGSGNPVDLKFLDFQQVRRGNIFEDLTYFIFTSTTPEFRKKNLVQMLEVYHNSFVSALEQIKCPIPIGFTRGRIIDTFYEVMLSSYVYMIFAIPFQLADQVDPAVKKAARQEQQKKNSSGEAFDPSKASMEQIMAMMTSGMEARSTNFFEQMLKSPRGMDRLVDITNEMAEMKVI